ncbi:MAG: hypothetical protein HY769_08500 [Candidatus Stahlbacteria bacterium]|nr:hypothetical protein [Candidatus Stahlbacteria bacterium]
MCCENRENREMTEDRGQKTEGRRIGCKSFAPTLLNLALCLRVLVGIWSLSRFLRDPAVAG